MQVEFFHSIFVICNSHLAIDLEGISNPGKHAVYTAFTYKAIFVISF